MVVSKSTKIGTRQAEENAKRQAQVRAASLAAQQKAAGNTEQANYFQQKAGRSQNPMAVPTNDLGLGVNPANQNFDFFTNTSLTPSGTTAAPTQSTTPTVNTPKAVDTINALGGAAMQVKNEQTGDNGNREYVLEDGTRVSADWYDSKIATDVNTAKETSRTQDTIAAPATTPTADLFSQVPAEYQPFIQQMAQSNDTAQLANQKAVRAADIQAADNTFNAEQQFANNQAKEDAANFISTQATIEESARKQKAFLDEQKRIELDAFALEEERALYKAEQDKKQQVYELTNSLAINGGFGSGNGIKYLQETEAKLNQHVDWLDRAYDIDRRKILQEFKADYLDIEQNADNNLTIATKEYQASVKALNSFKLQSRKDKEASKASAEGKYATAVNDVLKERQKRIDKAVEVSMNLMIAEKEEKRKDEQQAFTELKWYKDTYGTQLPDGVLESIQNRLPNLDVNSFINTKTLAERKAEASKARARSVSNAWAASFTPQELKTNGALPSFEEYLAKRKQDEGFYNMPQGVLNKNEFSLGLPAKAAEELFRSRIQKEYSTKVAEANRISVPNITNMLRKATSGSDVPKHTRDNAVKNVDQLLAAGDYEGAYEYVDGLGQSPVATERAGFSKALVARQNVKMLAEKFNDIENIGPVYGRIRELNPYDSKIVEIEQLTKATVPGLARGVFGEVGVLTESDIKNYTKVMANPRLTTEQAKTATNNLLDIIDYNVKAQLDTLQASGIATKPLRSLYEGAAVPQSNPEVDNYLNSLK